MKPTHPFYTQRCRMTCLGGSEKGTCPCKSPKECEAKDRPEYPLARLEAVNRMLRHLNNLVGK